MKSKTPWPDLMDTPIYDDLLAETARPVCDLKPWKPGEHPHIPYWRCWDEFIMSPVMFPDFVSRNWA
jgi:hypothetical protein